MEEQIEEIVKDRRNNIYKKRKREKEKREWGKLKRCKLKKKTLGQSI